MCSIFLLLTIRAIDIKSSKQIKDYGHNEIMKRQLPIFSLVLKRLAICFERKPFLLLVAYYNVRVGKLFLQRLVV